ncbi:MAG: radical SAM protein [Bacteroidales bacterium]|nr:radical SAM protein [Bacteroidales bacterium]
MISTISGYKAIVIRFWLHFNIALIVFSSYKNPFKVLRILSAIKAKRKNLLGLQPISRFIKSGRRYFFSDNIPGWPSRAFRGYFRAELIRTSGTNGISVPFSTVFISVSSRCPLRCLHCYEWENLSDRETLSLEQLKDIINKVKEYGAFHIQFSGGEPLMRMDDLQILIRYAGDGADVWINTSGFGLTREKALLLKKAGLTGAEISLDHWDEGEHNRFRANAQAFRWAGEAVKNCNEAGLVTCLSLCTTSSFVTRENLDKYADLAMRWGVSFIRVLDPRKTARFNGQETELSGAQIQMLEDFFLNASSPGSAPNYPIVSYPGYHQRRIGCMGAGNRYIYIDPRGEIHACPFCRGSAGNALTVSIEDTVATLKARGCHQYSTFKAE